jgi:hypothetical protein
MTTETTARRLGLALLLALLAVGLASCGGGDGKKDAAAEPPKPGPHAGADVVGGFDDLFRAYRPGVPEDAAARREAWNTYAGNLVTWSGPFHRAERTAEGTVIEIVHARMPDGRPAGRASVLLTQGQDAAAFALVPGQTVTYRARVERVEPLPDETVVRLTGGTIVRVQDRD